MAMKMWHRIKVPRDNMQNISNLEGSEILVTVDIDSESGVIDVSCSESVLTFLILQHGITVLPSPFARYRSGLR